MMQYSVSNQVIFEGLWRAQEIAWSQHDFKGGHTGQAPWMMAVCSDQNYRSVIIKSKYWVLKHFPEALQCTILSYLKMVGREEAWVNLDQSHVQILTVDLNKFFSPTNSLYMLMTFYCFKYQLLKELSWHSFILISKHRSSSLSIYLIVLPM